MPKYVAFLRAINVGGHIVKMDHLRSLFETIGCSKVETFIASGNVIFDSRTEKTKDLEKKIERHLQKSLGYEVATFIRSVAELSDIAQYKPFADSILNANDNNLYIAFLAEEPDRESVKRLQAFTSPSDKFRVFRRECYWLLSGRFGDSKFSGALLEKTLGMKATIRNSTTVKKIASKYS